MTASSIRELSGALLFLCGASVAVFVTGTHDVVAMVAVAVGGGLGLLTLRPTSWPGWLPVGLAVLYAAGCATALLPADQQ